MVWISDSPTYLESVLLREPVPAATAPLAELQVDNKPLVFSIDFSPFLFALKLLLTLGLLLPPLAVEDGLVVHLILVLEVVRLALSRVHLGFQFLPILQLPLTVQLLLSPSRILVLFRCCLHYQRPFFLALHNFIQSLL